LEAEENPGGGRKRRRSVSCSSRSLTSRNLSSSSSLTSTSASSPLASSTASTNPSCLAQDSNPSSGSGSFFLPDLLRDLTCQRNVDLESANSSSSPVLDEENIRPRGGIGSTTPGVAAGSTSSSSSISSSSSSLLMNFSPNAESGLASSQDLLAGKRGGKATTRQKDEGTGGRGDPSALLFSSSSSSVLPGGVPGGGYRSSSSHPYSLSSSASGGKIPGGSSSLNRPFTAAETKTAAAAALVLSSSIPSVLTTPFGGGPSGMCSTSAFLEQLHAAKAFLQQKKGLTSSGRDKISSSSSHHLQSYHNNDRGSSTATMGLREETEGRGEEEDHQDMPQPSYRQSHCSGSSSRRKTLGEEEEGGPGGGVGMSCSSETQAQDKKLDEKEVRVEEDQEEEEDDANSHDVSRRKGEGDRTSLSSSSSIVQDASSTSSSLLPSSQAHRQLHKSTSFPSLSSVSSPSSSLLLPAVSSSEPKASLKSLPSNDTREGGDSPTARAASVIHLSSRMAENEPERRPREKNMKTAISSSLLLHQSFAPSGARERDGSQEEGRSEMKSLDACNNEEETSSTSLDLSSSSSSISGVSRREGQLQKSTHSSLVLKSSPYDPFAHDGNKSVGLSSSSSSSSSDRRSKAHHSPSPEASMACPIQTGGCEDMTDTRVGSRRTIGEREDNKNKKISSDKKALLKRADTATATLSSSCDSREKNMGGEHGEGIDPPSEVEVVAERRMKRGALASSSLSSSVDPSLVESDRERLSHSASLSQGTSSSSSSSSFSTTSSTRLNSSRSQTYPTISPHSLPSHQPSGACRSSLVSNSSRPPFESSDNTAAGGVSTLQSASATSHPRSSDLSQAPLTEISDPSLSHSLTSSSSSVLPDKGAPKQHSSIRSRRIAGDLRSLPIKHGDVSSSHSDLPVSSSGGAVPLPSAAVCGDISSYKQRGDNGVSLADKDAIREGSPMRSSPSDLFSSPEFLKISPSDTLLSSQEEREFCHDSQGKNPLSDMTRKLPSSSSSSSMRGTSQSSTTHADPSPSTQLSSCLGKRRGVVKNPARSSPDASAERGERSAASSSSSSREMIFDTTVGKRRGLERRSSGELQAGGRGKRTRRASLLLREEKRARQEEEEEESKREAVLGEKEGRLGTNDVEDEKDVTMGQHEEERGVDVDSRGGGKDDKDGSVVDSSRIVSPYEIQEEGGEQETIKGNEPLLLSSQGKSACQMKQDEEEEEEVVGAVKETDRDLAGVESCGWKGREILSKKQDGVTFECREEKEKRNCSNKERHYLEENSSVPIPPRIGRHSRGSGDGRRFSSPSLVLPLLLGGGRNSRSSMIQKDEKLPTEKEKDSSLPPVQSLLPRCREGVSRKEGHIKGLENDASKESDGDHPEIKEIKVSPFEESKKKIGISPLDSLSIRHEDMQEGDDSRHESEGRTARDVRGEEEEGGKQEEEEYEISEDGSQNDEDEKRQEEIYSHRNDNRKETSTSHEPSSMIKVLSDHNDMELTSFPTEKEKTSHVKEISPFSLSKPSLDNHRRARVTSLLHTSSKESATRATATSSISQKTGRKADVLLSKFQSDEKGCHSKSLTSFSSFRGAKPTVTTTRNNGQGTGGRASSSSCSSGLSSSSSLGRSSGRGLSLQERGRTTRRSGAGCEGSSAKRKKDATSLPSSSSIGTSASRRGEGEEGSKATKTVGGGGGGYQVGSKGVKAILSSAIAEGQK
ncbi:hypothetical protein CSUI_009052, partial [Cystoisospora suis]